jgi:hypothetical protein
MGAVSPWVKWPGHEAGHSCPYSAQVKNEWSSMFPLIFILQLCGPAAALSRKFLHDLTTAQHFKIFFVIYIIRIFTMKIKNFQLHSNNSVCVGAFQLLHARAAWREHGWS